MENDTNSKETPGVMDKTFSWLYWIRIAISPILLSVILAFGVLWSLQNTWGIIMAVAIVAVGFAFGYRMAEKARKTIGTMEFMAKNMHNTEFDPPNKTPKQ